MSHPVKVRTSEGWQDVAQGATGPPGPPGAGVAPPGVLMPFAGTVPPTGFLFCDGAPVSRVTYADLFAVIGTVYGVGDGSTTFNLPNMKGRVPVGHDPTQTEFDALGEQGGAKTQVLVVANMPSHSHGGVTGLQSADHAHGTYGESVDHVHQYLSPYGYLTGIYTDAYGPQQAIGGVNWAWTGGRNEGHTHSTGGVNANHNHGVTAEGGGTGHNNLQPYAVVNWIIKT